MVNIISNTSHIAKTSLLAVALVYLPSYFPASLSHAQTYTITQHCETTVIQLPDGSILPDSEITTCDVNIEETTINDISGADSQAGTACASGLCSDGPAVSPQTQCQMEQVLESKKDQLAQDIAKDISNKDSTVEHGTFIVEHDGKLVALEIVSGSGNSLPLDGLYAQMNTLGINDTQIRSFIHSHPPSTNSNPIAAEDGNFINGFPSDNDYIAYQEFANNAQNFGAIRSDWEGQFSAYVIGPDGTLREFEDFTQPESQNFSDESGKSIPRPGESGHGALQNSLDQAQADANNQCGGG